MLTLSKLMNKLARESGSVMRFESVLFLVGLICNVVTINIREETEKSFAQNQE
jgi:hypothetical protein